MRINNKLVLECCCEKAYKNDKLQKIKNKKVKDLTIGELIKIIKKEIEEQN